MIQATVLFIAGAGGLAPVSARGLDPAAAGVRVAAGAVRAWRGSPVAVLSAARAENGSPSIERFNQAINARFSSAVNSRISRLSLTGFSESTTCRVKRDRRRRPP